MNSLLVTAPRPPPRWLRVVNYAAAAFAVVLIPLAVILLDDKPYPQRLDHAVFDLLIVLPPIAVGLYSASSPRHLRFGLLLLATGLAWSLTALAAADESLPYSIGRVAAWLMFPAMTYVILAFPEGRLAPGRDCRLFAALALVVAVLFVGSAPFIEAYPLQTPWATCGADCPRNAFLVLHSEPAVMENLVRPLREGLAVLLLIAVTTSLARRMRAASPLQRRTGGPVLIVSLAWTLLLIAYFASRWIWPGARAVDTLGVIWSLCIPGVAIAFFVGLVRRRLFVGEVLADLSVALGGRLD